MIHVTCNKPYGELIGTLMFLMLGTRPDLCFCVNYFSRFQNNYNNETWLYLKRVLNYLKETKDYGIMYTRKGTESTLDCYVDSDWAGDYGDRKSTTGYLFK